MNIYFIISVLKTLRATASGKRDDDLIMKSQFWIL